MSLLAGAATHGCRGDISVGELSKFYESQFRLDRLTRSWQCSNHRVDY
jgi:hypothetical protein